MALIKSCFSSCFMLFYLLPLKGIAVESNPQRKVKLLTLGVSIIWVLLPNRWWRCSVSSSSYLIQPTQPLDLLLDKYSPVFPPGSLKGPNLKQFLGAGLSLEQIHFPKAGLLPHSEQYRLSLSSYYDLSWEIVPGWGVLCDRKSRDRVLWLDLTTGLPRCTVTPQVLGSWCWYKAVAINP